ncbi:MAG: ATP-binding protein, partial [Gammaproteobacteria bacterium]|nr:ATP-binding protein [Gammaproteobacteria bacterium]
ERINTLADSVQTAYVKYNELSYFRNQLKLSFILILTLVFLFSMFSAVWAAFYTARRLVAPIRDLAEGTRSVADGDYSTQLPVPANDELGFLVASFNEMTRRIAKSRNAVRQSQHEAEAQRAYLEAILGRLSSGVLVLDNAMQLRTANISSGYILGLEISSRIGKSLDDLEAEYNYLEPFFKTIKTQLRKKTNDWREQLTLFGTSGRQILMCSGTSLSINEDEDIVHVIVFDDITVLIQGQRDAAWSEMARRLAHEIKNPLTPIQLAAERLQLKYLGSLPPDQADTLNRLTNTIIQQVETMKDMVNTFSEYARAPAITLEPVDLNKLIQEVVDLYSNLDVNAKIHMQLNSELPLIMADPSRLRQVLNNLLNNAFDASSHESQTILNISTNHIFETGMEYIEVRVRDSGQGLSQDIIAGIFEPYVTTKKKGTGLGLAIVKKIVEEHSGVVMLENNSDGRGACAIIRLPVNSETSSRVQTNLAKGVI